MLWYRSFYKQTTIQFPFILKTKAKVIKAVNDKLPYLNLFRMETKTLLLHEIIREQNSTSLNKNNPIRVKDNHTSSLINGQLHIHERKLTMQQD